MGHRFEPRSLTFKASKRTYEINFYVRLFVLMLRPTILSINWFFSFILLTCLDGIQRNKHTYIFQTQCFDEFFFIFWAKNERFRISNIIYLLRLNRTIRKKRMWDIALRNGTLDWNAEKNEQRSADVTGSGRQACESEFNYTGYEGERSGQKHRAQKDTSKKRVHSVNPFCFLVFCLHSLINHCEERYS